MGKVVDFLSQTKVLEEAESPINGNITVIKSLAFGTYIQVEGLTQSGGVVRDVWRTTLKKVKGKRQEVKDCLILGLGGGSAAKLVRKYWPEAKITGVEIDKNMVQLGKKYLGLEKLEVKIIIEDAEKVISQWSPKSSAAGQAKVNGQKLDLVLVDMYVGTKIPKKFETEDFIEAVKAILGKDGIAVFNRLYYDEKKHEAEVFHRKLIHAFKKVRPVYPEANVMYVCSN